jgi:hypothetical protein
MKENEVQTENLTYWPIARYKPASAACKMAATVASVHHFLQN